MTQNPEWMEQWLDKGWHHNFHTHPEDSYMECVIFESRRHPGMGRVLRNFSCMFPNSKMTIVYDKANHDYVTDCIEHSTAINLIPLHINGNFTIWNYCELLTTPAFWDLFPHSKRVMIFQADTGIRKNRVLRYLEYPYIGAPWGGAPKPMDEWIHVGNGGLSLRDPKVMKDVCMRFPYAKQDIAIEDLYFSQRVANMDHLTWPEKDVAASFSMEHVLHDDPMGFHQIYNWHPMSILEPLAENCDPVKAEHDIAHIHEVWIEAANGCIIKNDDLKPWLTTGIGPRGLVIPRDTLVPFEESERTKGFRKKLNVSWADKATKKIHTCSVPLRKKRVIHDVVVGSTESRN